MEPFCAGSFFASNFSIGPMLFFPPTITLKSTTTRAIENTKAAKSGSGRGCAFSQHRAYAVLYSASITQEVRSAFCNFASFYHRRSRAPCCESLT